MRFVVLGGGTAGSLSALMLKKMAPNIEVSMIASSAIGTVGPGEGVTPAIKFLLKDLNIDEDEFLKESGGTKKTGIVYKNWNKKNITFTHPFDDPMISDIYKNTNDYIKNTLIGEFLGNSQDLLNPSALAAHDNKLISGENNSYGYHIDSSLLINFLHKKAIDAGIEVIDDEVIDVKIYNDGNIKSLLTKTLKNIEADFFIDCSGFKRLLIGKTFSQKWITVSDQLPLNSAIACTLPIDKNARPYTEAIAMSSGWSWKIPLQHRYGCGYVYDNKLITKEEATEEIKRLYGKDLKIINYFNFDSGFFENVLVNNCLAIGLSSGFFEPLETTSIDGAVDTMKKFIKDVLPILVDRSLSKQNVDDFNASIRETNFMISMFLYLHYLNSKDDTDFWKTFTEKYYVKKETKDIFDKIINDFSNYTINKDNITKAIEKMYAWHNLNTYYCIYLGNGNMKQQSLFDKTDILAYNNVIDKVQNIINKNSIQYNIYKTGEK